MKQVSELLETGLVETFHPKKRDKTLRQFLERIKILELMETQGAFGVLLNGTKIDMENLDISVSKQDEIIVIPHIKGGA